METGKRKTLGDITNGDNLILTSLPPKLVASSANSNSISKPPFPILRSISSSTNQRFYSGSEKRSNTRSDTSIGSSNISSARNSRAFRFQTSSTYPSGDAVSKIASHYQILNIEKFGKRIQADAAIFSPTPDEKRKDKRKPITVTLCSPRPAMVNNHENSIHDPFSLLEKTKQMGRVKLGLPGELAQYIENFGKGIFSPYRCSYEKLEKGKGTIISSDSSVGKTEEMGKGSGKHPRRPLEKAISIKKGTLKLSGFFINESRDLGKEILDSRFIIDRSKKKGKALDTFGSSHEEIMDKGKAILLRFDDTANCPPPRNKSGKRKPDVEISSCLPRLRTKHIPEDPDVGGNTEPLKSWTGPLAVTRKALYFSNQDVKIAVHLNVIVTGGAGR